MTKPYVIQYPLHKAFEDKGVLERIGQIVCDVHPLVSEMYMFIRAFILYHLESSDQQLPIIDRQLCTFIKSVISNNEKNPTQRRRKVKKTKTMTDEQFNEFQRNADEKFEGLRHKRQMMETFHNDTYRGQCRYSLPNSAVMDYEIQEIIKCIETHIMTIFHQ